MHFTTSDRACSCGENMEMCKFDEYRKLLANCGITSRGETMNVNFRAFAALHRPSEKSMEIDATDKIMAVLSYYLSILVCSIEI